MRWPCGSHSLKFNGPLTIYPGESVPFCKPAPQDLQSCGDKVPCVTGTDVLKSPLLHLPLVSRPMYSTFWVHSIIELSLIRLYTASWRMEIFPLKVSSPSWCLRRIFTKLFHCFMDQQILSGIVFDRTSEPHGYVHTSTNWCSVVWNPVSEY